MKWRNWSGNWRGSASGAYIVMFASIPARTIRLSSVQRRECRVFGNGSTRDFRAVCIVIYPKRFATIGSIKRTGRSGGDGKKFMVRSVKPKCYCAGVLEHDDD